MVRCESSEETELAQKRVVVGPFFMLAVGTALLFGASLASATETLEATTSGAARRDALSDISPKKIDSRYRQAVQQVLNNCSLYRRLPTTAIPSCLLFWPKIQTRLSRYGENLASRASISSARAKTCFSLPTTWVPRASS